MRTTSPAAWPALSFRQRVAAPRDPVRPRLFLLGGGHPANPFVPRERRNIVPRLPRGRESEERFLEIGRQSMDDTAREFLFSHDDILSENLSGYSPPSPLFLPVLPAQAGSTIKEEVIYMKDHSENASPVPPPDRAGHRRGRSPEPVLVLSVHVRPRTRPSPARAAQAYRRGR